MALKQTSLFDLFEELPPAADEQPHVKPAKEKNAKAVLAVPDVEVKVEIIDIPEMIFAPVVTETFTPANTRGRASFSSMDAALNEVQVPADEELFKKSYYPIGAVAEMFAVNVSLIRFWENEFDILKPKKNGKGDRLFRPQDVKNLQLIYYLLREKKYSIPGAKTFLQKNKRAQEAFATIEDLKKIKQFLLEIRATL